MAFTVEEFHDLIRLLHERPDWRDDLRRVVLTDSLLNLPNVVADLRRRCAQGGHAQPRRAATTSCSST
jgi:hypothetical protein